MRQISAADVRPEWPVLEPLEGCRERPIALNKPVCVAGDRARVNLTLPDATVSRAHAIFVADEHGVYFRDLASLNHVFVNEEPVREAPLHAGDVLKIGPYAFKCHGGVDSPSDGVESASTAPAGELRTPDDAIHVPLDARRTTVLGSRDDCDVKMSGGNVSPAHAVIFEMHERRHIRDLRSISGTFINGRKVGQAELNPGDEIRIGESKLIYAAAPAHDPDGTLAGILAEGEAPTMDEVETGRESEAPAAVAELATPSDELDAIPLMDDSGELRSLAREFAEEKESPSPASEPVESKADSAIIPLLDDSEVAPGIAPEPAVGGIPAAEDSAIPLAEDSAAPVPTSDKPARAHKRDASEPRAYRRKQTPGSPSDSRTPGRNSGAPR